MKNKIALVTGSTSGIGLEIAKQLLSNGAKVIINYNSDSSQAIKATNEIKKYKENFITIKADVSDEDAVASMFKQIKAKYGHLDFLINNAGINTDAFIEKFDASEFKLILNVNLVGKFLCTKHAIPLLKKSKSGAIVNISSNLGLRPCAEASAYNAAAAGIINLTQTTALELDGTGIRTNTICPGFTPTPLSLAGWTAKEIEHKKKINPMGRLATTTDVANMVLFLLSDQAAFINGQTIGVDGGSIWK